MSKRIIVTSGGTSEPIDRVRKITNMSSGALGAIIADQLTQAGVDVIYVCSKTASRPVVAPAFTHIANSTQEVYEVLKDLLKNTHIDAVIHAMAISDYTVDYLSTTSLIAKMMEVECGKSKKQLLDNPISDYVVNNDTKISSSEDGLIIKLKKTPKIIGKIKKWNPNVTLVGFKLLQKVPEAELIRVANELAVKNKCDYVVANDLSNIGQGKHPALILHKGEILYRCDNKKAIAETLTDIII